MTAVPDALAGNAVLLKLSTSRISYYPGLGSKTLGSGEGRSLGLQVGGTGEEGV